MLRPIAIAAAAALLPAWASGATAAAPGRANSAPFLEHYCLDCHDAHSRKGGLVLESVDLTAAVTDPGLRERVPRKLQHRQMPPPGEDRPDEANYDALIARMASVLDRAAAARPDPGRAAAVRRLTRAEYQNAIRDLLALDIDATTLLPTRSRATASTTSPWAPCRRRCSTVTSRRPRRSRAWPSGRPARPPAARPTASPPT